MNTDSPNERLAESFERIRAMDASLGAQLEAFSESLRQRRPDFAAAVDRLIERLRQNGAGEQAPQPGDSMPPFVLPDDTGRMVSLEQLTAAGPVAVTFHRGHWCPYCRISIKALAQAHAKAAESGGQIVAIMPDRQPFTAEIRDQAGVRFPILTDIDNGYALSLNLAIFVGDELRTLMQDRHDLPSFQGNSAWMLPIPATFVVGRDGRIKARFVDPDYRRRMAIDELLAALRS
jgi:peroxiredoxin